MHRRVVWAALKYMTDYILIANLQNLENKVQTGSTVFEKNHVLVLGWCENQRDEEVIWKILSQVWTHLANFGFWLYALTLPCCMLSSLWILLNDNWSPVAGLLCLSLLITVSPIPQFFCIFWLIECRNFSWLVTRSNCCHCLPCFNSVKSAVCSSPKLETKNLPACRWLGERRICIIHHRLPDCIP